jgi:STE24 endopeptidase
VRAVTSPPSPGQAKAYNRIKLSIGVTSSVLTFLLMVILVVSGFTRDLSVWASSVSAHRYAALLLFTFALGIFQAGISLPLGFVSGYIVEHRFHLSNQSFWRWAWQRAKGLLVSLPIAAGIVILLFASLETCGTFWWLPLSIALTLLSVVFARLAPVLIMPLFYRFTPITEGSLRDRILRLCETAGLRIEGIFTFNLSKNTRKANAGFTGLGRAKRIILGDTLMRDFTEDEIETVFAHELGHYRYHHLGIGIAVGTLSTVVGLFVTAQLHAWSLRALGFTSLTDLAALPLLAIWLSLFGLVTAPLGNILSRRHERQADRFAVEETGKATAFTSALRKLAETNLADPEPHPLVEFLFYSHPAIGRRVRAVESMGG